jgi:DNA-binding MarR family transcriptional regulator
MAEKLKKLKIGYGQFPFLLYLSRCGPATQEEITRALFFDKATTARALKKLEELGLVSRSVSGKDHRCNIVAITDSGKSAALKIRGILKDWNNELAQGMNEEERDRAFSIVASIAQNATRSIKELEASADNRR